MKKPLIAAQTGMWLPLLGFFIFMSLGPAQDGGKLQYLPLLLVPVGWLLSPAFALWNVLHALRALMTGEPDPAALRMALWHKAAMLPALALNFLFWFGAPVGLLNPWLFWLLPVVALPIALSIGAAWLSLLSTSAHVIAQVVLLWRGKKLPLKQGVIHIALQLLFALDTLSCVGLYTSFVKPAPDQSQS